MAITNYTELKSAVADWLARSDLTAAIPTFITLAESAFNRDLRTRAMERRAQAATVAGQAYYSWPGDFLELRAIQLNGSPVQVLEYRTPEQIRALDTAAGAGTPRYWTDVGASLQLHPAPTGGLTLEIDYYGKLDIAADGANWLLARHPDMYLYGALMQAEPYLGNDPRLQTWASLLQAADDQLDREEWRVKSGVPPAAIRSEYMGA